MPQFSLQWKSTVAERFDSDMNERATKTAAHRSILSHFGGTDGVTADNGMVIEVAEMKSAIEAAEQVATAISKVVTVVDEDFRQIHQTKARFAEDDVAGMLLWAADVVEKQGGRLAISADPPTAEDKTGTRWLVGLEFGEESPGSMMYGGAAYGEGATLAAALTALIRDSGL